MAKSALIAIMDDIQTCLGEDLLSRGFRRRGRTFNRTTAEGLTHAVNLQMGPSDPPGTTYLPGLRENLHGLFTVNLGVFVPEVHEYIGGGNLRSWIMDYNCCIRTRLADACGDKSDLWWKVWYDKVVTDDVGRRLVESGIPFLDRFSTRDQVLRELSGRSVQIGAGGNPPRIVMAIILARRGDASRARALLRQQAFGKDTLDTPPAVRVAHQEYVSQIAARLGLQRLDG